jgi:hypothetical protein
MNGKWIIDVMARPYCCTCITLLLLMPVVALTCSCAKPGQNAQLATRPLSAKEQVVQVTIEGDVRVPGKHTIVQHCDSEAICQAAGGWSDKREAEHTGLIFYLYRNNGGVTNREQMHFWDIATRAPRGYLVENGDRIVVKRVVY